MSSEKVNTDKRDETRLSDILRSWNLLTPEKLEVALKEQASLGENPRRLGEILVDLGFISETDILKALSFQLGMKYLAFSEFPKMIPDGSYPAVKFMKQYKLVPIGIENNVLKVAMAAPVQYSHNDTLTIYSRHR